MLLQKCTVVPKLLKRKDQDNYMKPYTAPAVLFEMLRSFTTLAATLNLSKTVEEIGVSRQTIRRHIDTLEDRIGHSLFVMEDRQYRLTPYGENVLQDAELLLSNAHAWLDGHSLSSDGLADIRHQMEDGSFIYAQQHKISDIWNTATPLLQKGLQCWVAAKFQLEDKAMKKIKPYIVVYRLHDKDWICVSVGEKSSYATWLGWSWAKSAIGSNFIDDPVNSEADRFLLKAYDAVSRNEGIRYDHIATEMTRKEGEAPIPVNYQRLLFACTFPDGKPAIASLIARTNRIDIPGIDIEKFKPMPQEDLMEFEI